MQRKTCLRQLFKLLPKSTQMLTALDADERPGSELARDRAIESTPAPAIEQQRPAGVDANGVVEDGDQNRQWNEPEAGGTGG